MNKTLLHALAGLLIFLVVLYAGMLCWGFFDGQYDVDEFGKRFLAIITAIGGYIARWLQEDKT